MAHLASTEFGVADSVLLPAVTEEAFVANLALRFAKDKIYTLIGEVLISVNPYKNLEIYTPAEILAYKNRAIFEREPHIYALANAAYTSMRRSGRDTCVVISGESGAGKTEASKHLLRFIAGVSNNSQRVEIERVKDILLASNPILEAFGNAKTTRNDNSSRFGKYMDVNFNFAADPVGGHINNYLLEKARVVKQQPGERNFHIFYMLLGGASDALLSGLHLPRDVAAYRVLCNAAVGAQLDDKAAWAELQAAFGHVGLAQSVQDTLVKIVAAVLHLGQVTFAPKGSDACAVSSPEALESAAKMLGAPVPVLEKCLTVRVRAAKGEIMESPLSAESAANARDALSKVWGDMWNVFPL